MHCKENKLCGEELDQYLDTSIRESAKVDHTVKQPNTNWSLSVRDLDEWLQNQMKTLQIENIPTCLMATSTAPATRKCLTACDSQMQSEGWIPDYISAMWFARDCRFNNRTKFWIFFPFNKNSVLSRQRLSKKALSQFYIILLKSYLQHIYHC